MEPVIAVRTGVGVTARIAQHQALRFSQVTIANPVLIVVRAGQKILRAPGFECVLGPGEAVAVAQNQVFDIVNTPASDGHYQADWLVWDSALIEDFARRRTACPAIETAQHLGRPPMECFKAVDAALEAVRQVEQVPDSVAVHRLDEVLVWLESFGARFELREPIATGARVRRYIQSSPAANWTASALADRVGMSEATLRRRLADENTTLGELIADVRMSFAMQLLQSTHLPISRIALDVGYESASRFAIRFRRRFGFAPSAIRGHHRPAARPGGGDLAEASGPLPAN